MIRLALADGAETDFPDFRFDMAAARAVHRNLVRIPAWTAKNLVFAISNWLAQLAPRNVVLGVVRETDGAILVDILDAAFSS